MNANRDDCIALVNRSPETVAVHDKTAWMNIFAKDYHLEDPVGSKLKVSPVGEEQPLAPLSRFYDTFMAPNDIAFNVTRDIVCANHVMRDLTLHVKMAGKLDSYVPMHLLYELVEEDGDHKVARLEAHWEYGATNKQVLRHGFAALPILAGMVRRMLNHIGWRGMLAFGESSKTVGEAGKRQLSAFSDALTLRDQKALVGLLEGDEAVIHWPYGEPPLRVSELLPLIGSSIHFNKQLAAGDRVTSTFTMERAGAGCEGVALFQFNPQTLKIRKVVFYFE